MNHHAYYVTGDVEEGVEHARVYGARVLMLTGNNNPDIITLRHDLFSVEEARSVLDIANRTSAKGKKLIIIAAHRIFHEAQNALLKVFEEPPEGTCLVLVVPSEGNIIPTLRSRLLALPTHDGYPMSIMGGGAAEEFLAAGKQGREKMVAKILDKAKSDKPEEKQAARIEALALAEGLVHAVYTSKNFIIYDKDASGGESSEMKGIKEVRAFLEDLQYFIPILHERSAPLKPILEHLLIIMPKNL